jgi:putative NADH-flavin reductase
MKIAIFGASGTIGQRILNETLNRGHQVTAIVRDPLRFNRSSENLSVVEGDVLDSASIAKVVTGHDVVIGSVGPSSPDGNTEIVVGAAQALLDGVSKAGVKRLLFVGGAGSLEVAPGVQLVDSPDFPAAFKKIALAHRDALNVFLTTDKDIDWVNISPAALIAPGERTGKFRIGKDNLIVDEKGESHISAEDYAVALADEIENPHHKRERITVAY